MTFDFAFATKVFAAMFAIMNPIANIPVFLSLTDGTSAAAQRRIAVTAIIGVSTGCVLSVLAGHAILGAFGLTVQDFRLAGGLLVLLIALSMLHGSASNVHSSTPAEKADTPAPENVAIYPLTIPLLVGPGTIATLIIFSQTARDEGKIIELALDLLPGSAGDFASGGPIHRTSIFLQRHSHHQALDGNDSCRNRHADDCGESSGTLPESRKMRYHCPCSECPSIDLSYFWPWTAPRRALIHRQAKDWYRARLLQVSPDQLPLCPASPP